MADLLTTSQVQDLLKVDRTTIYRMVEGGRLPAIRIGKQWRFAQTDIDQWLSGNAVSHNSINTQLPTPGALQGNLRELLPLACVQLIQDGFAEVLGVMMVTTDMSGQPVTQVSNPCGFFETLMRDPHAVSHCVTTWQQMALAPSIEPKLSPSEMGLMCARGLIRVGRELKGMVVMGGIAPEVWPPGPQVLADLAATFDVAQADIEAHMPYVYQLSRAAQDKALRTVQRVADIFSHILRDRNVLVAGTAA